MSEPFMPSDEEIRGAIDDAGLVTNEQNKWYSQWGTGWSEPIRTLVRAAVEKAVAGEREAWQTACGLETSHGDPEGITPERLERFMSKEESRHARELEIARLEATLDTVIWATGAGLSNDDLDIFRARAEVLRAQLAALRGENETKKTPAG